MKKIIILIGLILILSINTLAAPIDFVLQKTTYNSLETVQLKLQLNIKPSTEIQTIKLKTQTGTEILLSLTKIKLNSTVYYFYFNLPKLNAGEYQLGVYDLYYTVGSATKRDSFSVSLQITNETQNILSIRPAYYQANVVDTEESPFNVDIIPDMPFLKKPNSLQLAPKTTKNIIIDTILYNKNGTSFNGNLILNYAGKSYTIPVNIKRTITAPIVSSEQNKTIVLKEVFIAFGNAYGVPLSNITLSLAQNETKVLDLTLINKGQDIISNILLESQNTSLVNIAPLTIQTINPNSFYPLILEINTQKKLQNNINTYVKTKIGNKEFILPINIQFIQKEIKEQIKIDNNYTKDVVVIPLSPQKSNINYFYVIFATLIIFFIIISYVVYKKSKPKQEEFEEFIENVKRKR